LNDDDPPSRVAPASSGGSLPPHSDRSLGAAVEWVDDETFVGSAPVAAKSTRPSMSARALLSDPALGLKVRLLAGEGGSDRGIAHTRIQKSGLALAGHDHGIVATRIQILGQTEQSYLERLDDDARQAALQGFFALGLSCVFLTGELGPAGADLVRHAEATDTPLVHASERSSVTITALHALLDERLAPRKRLHGVLIDVFGVGLLIMGPSGVGKSECALDLVMRGHRLVADDVVECDYRPPGMLFGQPAKLLRHHLEVRGLGILNIKDLFGVTAIRERKRIDVVVRLVQASDELELDRLGLDERFEVILGVSVPELAVPVRPGRDMASILEVAARNELLKNAGHHAARELFGQIESSIHAQSAAMHGDTPSPRSVRTVTEPSPALEARLRAARLGASSAGGEAHARANESSAPPPVGPRPGPGKDVR
jgi:HPr kinase/phosphorylase